MNTKTYLSRPTRQTFGTLVLIVGIFLLLNSTKVHAYKGSIIVDSLADSGGATLCTLRDALQAANIDSGVNGCTAGSGMDTITFGTLAGTIVLNSELVVDSNVTIQGNGNIVIDGNEATRLIRVASGTVIFDTLTMQNGDDASDECSFQSCGGAIKMDAGTEATLLNSIVSGNEAMRGGAIYVGGNTLTVQNSVIGNNYAHVIGGGVISGGTLIVQNSIINDNFVYGDGGGIVSGGTLIVEDSTISNNEARFLGGGIVGGSSTLISNSTINGNTADWYGGGVLVGGTTTIMDSTIRDNFAGYGGGIYNEDRSVIVQNSTISGNSSGTEGAGGGIYNTFGNVTVNNSTLMENFALTGGGIESYGGTVTVNNSIIAESPDGGNCNIVDGVINVGLDNLSDDTSCIDATVSNNINLAELADNGCTIQHTTLSGLACVQTHALLLGSIAIDNPDSDTDNATSSDQRDFAVYGVSRDIGAFEFQGGASAVTLQDNAISTNSGMLLWIVWSLLIVMTSILWRRFA